jgi:hypothetical protein
MSTAAGLMARHARAAHLLWPHAALDPALSHRWWAVPGILLLAVPVSLLAGAWALLLWLLLPLARRG